MGRISSVSSGDKSLRVWNLATGEVVSVLKERMGMVLAVAYSPDATNIAFGSSDRTLRVWSLSTGENVRAFKKHTDRIRSVAYSPHGDILVSASDDKSPRIWNLATGKEVMVLKGHTSRMGHTQSLARATNQFGYGIFPQGRKK